MLRAAELEMAIVFEYDEAEPDGDRTVLRGDRAPPPRGRPDVPRPAARPSARAQASGAPARRGRRDMDPGERLAQLVRELPQGGLPSAGFEPKVGFRSDDYNVVQGLVASGMGVSLLPSLALANMREDIVCAHSAEAPRAQDRRGHARGPLSLAGDRGDARDPGRGGGRVRAALRRRDCRLALGDLPGHDGGVLANADQERRLPLAEEVHAREVQPRDRRCSRRPGATGKPRSSKAPGKSTHEA